MRQMRAFVEQQVLASLLAYLYPAQMRTTGTAVPCRSSEQHVWPAAAMSSGYGWLRPGWPRTWMGSRRDIILIKTHADSYRKFNDWMIFVEKVLGGLKDRLKTNA